MNIPNETSQVETLDSPKSPNSKMSPSPDKRYFSIPAALDAELIRMRRDPHEFTVLSMVHCKFCAPKTKSAYELGHPLSTKGAGTWCLTHGWLYFESSKIRPRGEEYIPKKRGK